MTGNIDYEYELLEESAKVVRNVNNEIDNNLVNLYHHVMKYMCQQQIQTTSHMDTIKRIIDEIQELYKKVNDPHQQKDVMDHIKSTLPAALKKAANMTTKNAMKANEKFNRHLDLTEITKAFPPKYVLDPDGVSKFLKEYAVRVECMQYADVTMPKGYTSNINANIPPGKA